MVLISEIFYNFLGILWTLVIPTYLIKLLTKLPSMGETVLKVIQQRLTQWPNEIFNNEGVGVDRHRQGSETDPRIGEL